MAYDVQVWRERLSHRMEGWKGRWEKARSAGVPSLYGFLSAMALWPVVEAAQQGEWAALATLGGVAADVGGNLLANQIQSWKDEADAARELTQAAEENEEIRSALDAVLERLEVVAQAQASLDEADRAWFAETLREELARLGNQERYHAVLVGSGAIAQGVGAKAAGERGIVADVIHGPVATGDRVVQAQTYIDTYVVKQKAPPDPAQARVTQARQRYLKRLYQQCNALPLGALGGDEGTGDEVTLEQVYVDLNTRTHVPISEEEKAQPERATMPPGRDTRPLAALEAVIQNRRLVLLGDPGSGVRPASCWYECLPQAVTVASR